MNVPRDCGCLACVDLRRHAFGSDWRLIAECLADVIDAHDTVDTPDAIGEAGRLVLDRIYPEGRR